MSNPAWSVVAITTPALGIGGITAIFAAFDEILIHLLSTRTRPIGDDLGSDG